MNGIQYIIAYYNMKYCTTPDRQPGNYYCIRNSLSSYGSIAYCIMLHEQTNPRILTYSQHEWPEYEADIMSNFLIKAIGYKFIVRQNALLQKLKSYFSFI
jgi:hypothetical protein